MISKTPSALLLFQIVAHLSFIPMIIYATWWQWLISFFIYFLSGCLGMTITYHRLLSHKSWKTNKFIEYLFTLFATIGLTGPAISWVAIHRQHHAYSDTEKDPHSPAFKGKFYSHYLSMFSHVEIKRAAHLLRENFYVLQHRYYFEINIVYAILLFCISPFSVIYAWLVPAAILWNSGSSIISVSHRNSNVYNDLPLVFLVWGEGYHLNHHKDPSLFKFGRWDLGGTIISMIKK